MVIEFKSDLMNTIYEHSSRSKPAPAWTHCRENNLNSPGIVTYDGAGVNVVHLQ